MNIYMLLDRTHFKDVVIMNVHNNYQNSCQFITSVEFSILIFLFGPVLWVESFRRFAFHFSFINFEILTNLVMNCANYTNIYFVCVHSIRIEASHVYIYVKHIRSQSRSLTKPHHLSPGASGQSDIQFIHFSGHNNNKCWEWLQPLLQSMYDHLKLRRFCKLPSTLARTSR